MRQRLAKVCPSCGQHLTLEDILTNPEVRPRGLVLERDNPETSMFYFDHAVEGCGTTFVIPVEQLEPFVDEPVPENLLVGSDCCETHCVRLEDWAECSQDCTNAPYRRLLLLMASHRNLIVTDQI